MNYPYLAQSLKALLETHISTAIRRNRDACVRPVLVGPPAEALETLFNILTNNGTNDWRISGVGLDIMVLYVHDSSHSSNPSTSPRSPGILSKICTWDYVVSARNNCNIVIMLVDPPEWDRRHESLANTTETLGGLPTESLAKKLQGSVWKHIINQIVQNSGVTLDIIRYTLNEFARQSKSVEPSVRDCMLWEVADDLLALQPSNSSSSNDFAQIAGLPALEHTSISIIRAFSLIRDLGTFLSKDSLKTGIEKLKNTNTARANALQPHIEALSNYIRERSLTGASFAQAPSWYYRRSGSPAPQWWKSLNAAILEQMLGDLDDRHPDKLNLQCTNALNRFDDKAKDEPFIVISEVHLHASAPRNGTLSSPTFSARADRNQYPITGGTGSIGDCDDTAPLTHEKPIRYQVVAPGFSAGFTEVLVLDQFKCRGIAWVRDAERLRPPVKAQDDTWKQDITLPRGGPVDLRIYHASNVMKIRMQVKPFSQPGLPQVPPGPPEDLPTVAGQPFVSWNPEIEHGDKIEVTLLESTNNKDKELAKWTIQFTVEDTPGTVSSYFEALVITHQDARGGRLLPIQPPDSPLQRLESEYLQSADSWKPVLACWSKQVDNLQKIDWTNPRLGDKVPDVDSRPDSVPPQTLLATREAIRQYLLLSGGQQPFGFRNLGEEALVQKVQDYLQAYQDWLKDEPEQATWFDCISVHDAQWNPEANDHVAKNEPTAMLLSPLHPLRLGWHCLAQEQLRESLTHRCPAAGLLDPHSCPDIGTWHIPEGSQSFVPKVFFTVVSEDPYWIVLINKDALEPRLPERENVLRRLLELGLRVRGVVGGFSVSQTKNSIDEVTKLLPARATLRLGVVGVSETSSECTQGIIDWCQDRFAREEDEALVHSSMPFAAEIYDLRGNNLPYPSPEQLATLSENTQEKVKWFTPERMSADHQLDLVILDQLGAGSPRGWFNTTRSPLGYGALFRMRVREDFQDAVWLDETRIGAYGPANTGIAGLLEATSSLFEKYAATHAQVSQLRFQPNRQAIGRRLEESTFLAVTSAQIDPAGIIRGARGQRGYLWDYLLPDVMGGDENSAGYYLVAEPLRAMENAIKQAVRIVTSTTPSDLNVQVILNEISRRGIPILKRLAAGGSQSRAELGMLLAVRLLQDAFRGEVTPIQLPVWTGECINLLLPVDPYQKPFDRLHKELGTPGTDQKPDLLVISIQAPAITDSPIRLKLTPVEVKFRSGRMSDSGDELQAALNQAATFGELLSALWTRQLPTPLWDICTTALLAQCLNLAFRIYADKDVHQRDPGDWTKLHERVLRDVLSKRAIIEVDKAGRLLVFDESSTSFIHDVNRDGQYDALILNRDDAKALLAGLGNLSPDATVAVKTLKFQFPHCGVQSESSPDTNAGAHLPASEEVSTQATTEQEDSSNEISTSQESTIDNKENNFLTSLETENEIHPVTLEESSIEVKSWQAQAILSPISIPRAFIG